MAAIAESKTWRKCQLLIRQQVTIGGGKKPGERKDGDGQGGGSRKEGERMDNVGLVGLPGKKNEKRGGNSGYAHL